MILHIDMDAFYASIEERDRPELRGQPVIVGGTPEGRGVVAAASYEARKFGVHSAMSAARALKLCPHAVCLPCQLGYYAEVSRQIHEIFHRFTPLVEPLSLDEAFLDARASEQLFGSSIEIGKAIQLEISTQLRLAASVGVAPNKFLAKIASDLEKPNGFVVVHPEQVQSFLDPLPVTRLWGVGRAAEKSLAGIGARTIHDFRHLPLELIEQRFGRLGKHLWELAHGIDQRPVVPDREAKSVSHETTFAKDISDREALGAWCVELSEQVARRLRRSELRGRTVTLKVRFSDFRTITRSKTQSAPTNSTDDIRLEVQRLFAERLPAKHLPVRLLGVSVSGLEPAAPLQPSLFADEENAQASLDQATDSIREKFGDCSLSRASQLAHHARHTPPPQIDHTKPQRRKEK